MEFFLGFGSEDTRDIFERFVRKPTYKGEFNKEKVEVGEFGGEAAKDGQVRFVVTGFCGVGVQGSVGGGRGRGYVA